MGDHHPGFDALVKRHALEVEVLAASIKAAVPKGFMGKKPSPAAVAAAEASGVERRAALAARHARELEDFTANPPSLTPAAAPVPVAAALQPAAAAAAVEHKAQEEEEEEEEEGGDGAAGGGGGGGGGGKKLSRKERRLAKQAMWDAEQARADARAAASSAPASASSAKEEEMRALLEQLTPLGLCISAIPADGNCLFRAVADQLQLQLQQADGAPVSAALTEHRALRARAQEFIRTYWEDFAPFLPYEAADGYAAAERAGDPRSAVIRYCERMTSSNAWGGHPEIRALANVLGCSVVVFRAGAKPLQFDPKGEERSVSGIGGRRQLRISFHAHQLSAGEHYNSCRSREARR